MGFNNASSAPWVGKLKKCTCFRYTDFWFGRDCLKYKGSVEKWRCCGEAAAVTNNFFWQASLFSFILEFRPFINTKLLYLFKKK